MRKAYIFDREPNKTNPSMVDYIFDSRARYAMSWRTKDDGDIFCDLVNRDGILLQDRHYLLQDFRSEERTPGEFIVYCEGPFAPQM